MMALGLAGGIRDTRHVRKVIIMRESGTTEIYNLKKAIRKGEFKSAREILIYPEDTVMVEQRRVDWSLLSFLATLSYALLRIVEIAFF